jgi:endonuclease III
MTRAKARRIFEQLRAANPAPQSELRYRSPFELLVAVILSAQATDKSVNLATHELFRRAATPRAMLKLGLAGLKRHIRTIGLYNAKARNILATSRILLENHDGEVPREREARQRGTQCGIRRTHPRGRHPRFSGRQSHRSGARCQPARRGG